MLEDFFILLGGSVLGLAERVKNFNFKKEKNKKSSNKEITSEIFQKLNLEVEKTPASQITKLDEIREVMLKYMMNKTSFIILLLVFLAVMIFAGPELGGIFLVSVVMMYVL